MDQTALLNEWLVRVRLIREQEGSILDVARALKEHGERGGKKIIAAHALRKEYGFSIRQLLELLSWAEDGATDDDLRAVVPHWP